MVVVHEGVERALAEIADGSVVVVVGSQGMPPRDPPSDELFEARITGAVSVDLPPPEEDPFPRHLGIAWQLHQHLQQTRKGVDPDLAVFVLLALVVAELHVVDALLRAAVLPRQVEMKPLIPRAHQVRVETIPAVPLQELLQVHLRLVSVVLGTSPVVLAEQLHGLDVSGLPIRGVSVALDDPLRRDLELLVAELARVIAVQALEDARGLPDLFHGNLHAPRQGRHLPRVQGRGDLLPTPGL
mmetsp:Transcript_160218/g.514016  ORF Transcript_160218/g.514016 Transcript_160218/m.514016 type:complete len:242 (+) Transcript_160218:49-774(+)